jgi:hypothetical protein
MGYARSMDWQVLMLCYPLLMTGILSLGFVGPAAFAIHGTVREIITQAYYAVYFNPRFYDRMNKILAKEEDPSNGR